MTVIGTDMRVTVESAKRIRFYKGSIPATNVQDAIELVASTPATVAPTPVTGSPFAPTNSDNILWVNTSTGAKVVNLQSGALRAGLPLEVKDITGQASTNNITINAFGGEFIDGLAAWTINIDYGGVRLYPKTDGTGWTTAPSGP